MITFDATVDFEAEGVLETELTQALAKLKLDEETVLAVHIPAWSGNHLGELLAGETEPSREVHEDDWYVIGRSVEELAMRLRALL